MARKRKLSYAYAAFMHDRQNAGMNHPSRFPTTAHKDKSGAEKAGARRALEESHDFPSGYEEDFEDIEDANQNGQYKRAIQIFNESVGGPNGLEIFVHRLRLL